MIAYKLVRKMKDGQLAPLFIDKKARLPIGEWIEAKDVPTKGYKHRPGWHSCATPCAPHLAERDNRIWVEVMILGTEEHKRPAHQGGTWYTSQWMMILREVRDYEVIRD